MAIITVINKESKKLWDAVGAAMGLRCMKAGRRLLKVGLTKHY